MLLSSRIVAKPHLGRVPILKSQVFPISKTICKNLLTVSQFTWANNVRPTSTICRCFHFVTLFCSKVCGHVTRWRMSCLVKINVNDRYSPPQSLCTCFMSFPNRILTVFWNWIKQSMAGDLRWIRKIPCESAKHINKRHILQIYMWNIFLNSFSILNDFQF